VQITFLDLLVIAVIFLSALLGAGRGLLRVILAAVACAIAQFATGFFLLATGLIQSTTVSSLVASVILFGGVLIMCLLFAGRISHLIFANQVGIIDRILGFFLGLPRGLLFAVLCYLFFSWLVPDQRQPAWVRGASTLLILQETGDWLMSHMPHETNIGFVTSGSGLLVDGFALSILVDLFAIITRWMGLDVRSLPLSRESARPL
jgi:membrane protein required for colicin V production